MAVKKKKPPRERLWMIDPIYRKFTAKAFKSLTASPEFYEFFQTMLKNGEHTFQFSNRRLDTQVDTSWVEIIEDTIPAFLEITRNPRIVITQEELITNVVQARRIDSQVVRHLCAHSYLVDAIDENGEVRPAKILNLLKEESWDTYENRFVYTLIKMTYEFVKKRYNDLKDIMDDEFGATLLIDSTAFSNMENVKIKSEMKIQQRDDLFDTADKQDSIFARILAIYKILQSLMECRFAKEMIKFQKVRPPLVPTNAIKKNPYLRKCHKLWDFLLAYHDVGFTIEIIEQNPEINEKFEQDIFNNIMFTYIILKGYLEFNRDRALDRHAKAQRRVLRPKYIREIVEELVESFDMPDVEVRKILIEELTKEQLMREEKSERYRLVEEQKKAKLEEKRQKELERLRLEKEKEKEARRLEKEKAKEKIRLEKERAKEQERLEKEKKKQDALDLKFAELLEKELTAQLDAANKRHEKIEKKKAPPAPRKKPASKKAASAPKKPKAKPEKTAQPEEIILTESAPADEVMITAEAEPTAEYTPEGVAEAAAVEELAAKEEAAPEIEALPEPEAAEETWQETAGEAEPTEEEPAAEEEIPSPEAEAAAPVSEAAETAQPADAGSIMKRMTRLFRRKN